MKTDFAPEGKVTLYTLIVLGVLTALAPVVNNMFAPSLPLLMSDFGVNRSSAQLGLTASMLGLALGQVIFGPLSDRSGRRGPLLGALAVMTVASAACAWAPSMTALAMLRLAQGIGAGGGIVIARSVAADISHGDRLIKVLAFVNVFNGLAPIVTPIAGGQLSSSCGWQGPLWGMLAVAAIMLVACLPLAETLSVQRRSGGDTRSALALLGSVWRNRACILTILHQGFALAVLFGNIAATPFVCQQYGRDDVGLMLGLNGVFTALGAGAAAAIGSARRGMRLCSGGLTASAAAMALALWGGWGFLAYEVIICAMLFFVGITLTSSSGHAMECARGEAGAASATLGMVGFVVGAAVAPVMGMGDTLRSAALVYVCAAVLAAVCCHMALKPHE